MSSHTHKFRPAPEIMGGICDCGVSRFGSRFGLAEYDPNTGRTIQVGSGKVLHSESDASGTDKEQRS